MHSRRIFAPLIRFVDIFSSKDPLPDGRGSVKPKNTGTNACGTKQKRPPAGFFIPAGGLRKPFRMASSGAGYGDQNNNAAYKDWGLSDGEGQRSGWICVQ